LPLLICAVGQQPDALDNITLSPNSIAGASVPQVDILRLMDCGDLFVHHGGQNSVMEGGYAGIPMVVSLEAFEVLFKADTFLKSVSPFQVCPTFSDQPVNAAKLVKLKVALSVDRPTKSGRRAVKDYTAKVAKAVSAIFETQESFAAAALDLKREIALGGGEDTAEVTILEAIRCGVW
jgi:UDP:flavonoid glycosyltransferase YjiC (YdhE family)